LSGTFQTAVQASQSAALERISVTDGKNVSVGLGLVLLEGIKAIEQKKNHEEAAYQIKNAAMNTQIFIGLPTLKYLGLSIAVAHTNASDIGECISKRIRKDFQLESVSVMNASYIITRSQHLMTL
jgi:hypothetical protein